MDGPEGRRIGVGGGVPVRRRFHRLRMDLREGAPLVTLGVVVIGIGIYALWVNARFGSSHFPIWLYLVALGGVAIVGGLGTSLAGEAMEGLARPGERVGEDLIAIPIAEWEAMRALIRDRLGEESARVTPPALNPAPFAEWAESPPPQPARSVAPPAPTALPSHSEPRLAPRVAQSGAASPPPVAPGRSDPPVDRGDLGGVANRIPARFEPAIHADWMNPKMPARAGPAPPSPRESGTAAPKPSPVSPTGSTGPGAPPVVAPDRRKAVRNVQPSTPPPTPAVSAPPAKGGAPNAPKRRPGIRAGTASESPRPRATDEVGDVIDILESALPSPTEAAPAPPGESGEAGPVNCRHCSAKIPANRPWLRCESCDGGLCLEGLVEAAEAGTPGVCPACRSLFGELTSE
ncbi:MAG: hypothetical protein L3K19_04480 [Thermoplasmata archaeon]|nr:hypothetical protein [Thermoplasmata archaeon]